MKTMLAVITMLVATTAVAQQANTLEMYKQSYETQERAILARYGKALDTVMADLKQKGDLDNVLILQAEGKRFDAEKTVPTPKDARDSFRPASEAYYRAMAALLRQYVNALDEVIKKEVVADRIEEAKVINVEKEKATLLLADIETKLPPRAAVEKPMPGKEEKPVSSQPSLKPKMTRIPKDSIVIGPDKEIMIEAENYSRHRSGDVHDWQRIKGERKDSTSHIWAGPANNTVYDLKQKDFEKRSPCVLYDLNFLKEGTYYVWIRGLGGAGDASVAVGYDEVLLKSQCVGFFGPKFGWLGRYLDGDRIAITVEASGAHTLGLWMVEDGVAIDKLIITANPKYDPKEL